MRRDRGFTLIELMVVLAITVFVLAATSKVLTGLFGQFKQQTKIAETSVQSACGPTSTTPPAALPGPSSPTTRPLPP
ncbi:MAG: prepilin-type N-terminal cleavage/methylation domain-containing protein [Nitrospirota bacterium]